MRLSVIGLRYIIFLLGCGTLPATAWAEGPHTNPALFSSLKSKMSYIGGRQAVLSRNIANADTPGYQSQDLEPFGTGQRRLHMRVTNPRHFSGGHSGRGAFRTIQNKDTFETTLSGNNVSLDEEMRKVAENNLDYQEATNLYRKWSGVMRMAITGNRQ